jgi:hypothetical protein
MDSPLAIEETVQFDQASHNCHKGPAQSYRVLGEPGCAEDSPEGAVTVSYPFDLYYRQGPDLATLFGRDWEWGSNGFLEVEFRPLDGSWAPASSREVLDFTGGEPPEMPPAGK